MNLINKNFFLSGSLQRFIVIISLLQATPVSPMIANTYDGVYVWVQGTCVCYQLESTPTITYGDGYVQLFVNDKNVLNIPITDSQSLILTFGTYYEEPSGFVDVPRSDNYVVHCEGKLIRGGRVIVIKDGKQYTLDGSLINNQ